MNNIWKSSLQIFYHLKFFLCWLFLFLGEILEFLNDFQMSNFYMSMIFSLLNLFGSLPKYLLWVIIRNGRILLSFLYSVTSVSWINWFIIENNFGNCLGWDLTGFFFFCLACLEKTIGIILILFIGEGRIS